MSAQPLFQIWLKTNGIHTTSQSCGEETDATSGRCARKKRAWACLYLAITYFFHCFKYCFISPFCKFLD